MIFMEIKKDVQLKKYNSFGIECKARLFCSVKEEADITALIKDPLSQHEDMLVLGGGSNLLFTRDCDALVLHNEILGIEMLAEDESHVYVKAGGGVKWHDLVMYCIRNNWAGIENLALIPGTVGASPIQNIGAYGVEIKDLFHKLEAVHLKTAEKITFNLKDCAFGYRDSIFKNKMKGEFFITSVTYRLNKKPDFKTSYGAIEQELDRMGVKELTITAIADAVINIRKSKLPDPSVIGNAGSFFKNPEISEIEFNRIQSAYPEVIGYPASAGMRKLAAGWMIESCGWKGYRSGDAGCHEKQALVLVNYGNASGKDIINLSNQIIASVEHKFGVQLEREVNVC
jgi:UDP-N-acetylmuramate dehydrogenase